MVLGLIETVDAVMGHISSNLPSGEPQITIIGSSSMAGSWAASLGVCAPAVRGVAVGTWGAQLLVEFCSTSALRSPARRKYAVPHTPSAQIKLSIFLNHVCCLMQNYILEEGRVRIRADVFSRDVHGGLRKHLTVTWGPVHFVQ